MSSDPMLISVANLLSNPALTYDDIARICKCSHATVARRAKQIRDSIVNQFGVSPELEQYKRCIRKRLPASKRVGVMEVAVKKAGSNPFAALKAVEYADKVLGMLPQAQDAQQDNRLQPMFALPAGSEIQVSITVGQDAIDVTPEGDKNG